MIRPYHEDDFKIVTMLWFEAMHVAMPDMMKRMGFELEGAREYFRNAIVQKDQLWVYESNGVPVAFLGIENDFLDRLYVAPEHHRCGVGQALLNFAKINSPNHLWLYTHVANKIARIFYEKNGFNAEKFGISPAPESEPDIEYHWRAK